ncbi:uncharacterized protein [Typha angustifolia]|uniref:uncharacterized protein isoform X1 n=1 Tax=Typha angustifolia TaxID=59011 RepID=UPI003C2EFDEB
MCNQGCHQSEPHPIAVVSCRSVLVEMDSTAAALASDESPRIAKFLCSFGGSILPRPLDGRLRYVGGETRIVTVPRDISYADLLARMRELFDGIDVIKYQQPDEDLDALVSVVNDDDVMNMMEEYDKLVGAGEVFTRLRIFLFSQQSDTDASSVVVHFDTDERETERRYVDALNSLTDAKTPPPADVTEHFYRTASIEGGFPSHLNLRQLNIPHTSHVPWYGEVDSPWSPAYFSPGQHPAHDPREFPPSPSSARFPVGPGEFGERISEDYVRQSPHLQHYDHQSPPQLENMVWLPPGARIQEKSGFPSNLGHSHNVMDGNSICEHCHMVFQRGQGVSTDARYFDPRWKHVQAHPEQTNVGSDYANHFPSSCADCYRSRETYLLNQDMKLDHGVYLKDQGEQHYPFYNESHSHERGYVMHRTHGNHRLEEPRVHISGNGRVAEHHVADGDPMSIPLVHGNFFDGHSVPPNFINSDDAHYFQSGMEHGSDLLRAPQTIGGGLHSEISGFEEGTMRYVNHPSPYVVDGPYQVQHNLTPIQSLRRKVQVPMRSGTPYEATAFMMPNGGISSGFTKGTPDGSPRLPLGADDQLQNQWSLLHDNMLQKTCGFDGSPGPEHPHHSIKLKPNITAQDVKLSVTPDSVHCQPGIQYLEVPSETMPNAPNSSCLVGGTRVASTASDFPDSSTMDTNIALKAQSSEEKDLLGEVHETSHTQAANGPIVIPFATNIQDSQFDVNGTKLTMVEGYETKIYEADTKVSYENGEISKGNLGLLPELIASVKRAALEDAEEVGPNAKGNADSSGSSVCDKNKSLLHEVVPPNTNAELQSDSQENCENTKIFKIESTIAETDALSKGLQTIKNDDLEEIRELGSGTYGSVFHGKWRGSDVAIKRIKASCFAGRPSERERLIADFWKEALILSSLHHPNVVSFYGVVRDGPDGSLATVTEFMVNGSLKQFLQKKDRTIDRRKRLIIAMDAAFGMEYLHGKNIVHFDLKCENLLVNMRDPQRPVCKIGDLGLSKVKQHTLVSGGVRGTLPWMAPELLSGKSNMVSEKIDVYSFGIVMWELLTGEEPYADMRCASIIGGIVNNTLRPQVPTWCDPEWKSLMESCWSSEPSERPSFSDISQKLRKMAAAINVK